jgi:hypothetical protein
LELDSAGLVGGGVWDVVTAGQRLLAITEKKALYLGAQGSGVWEKLVLPDSLLPTCVLGWDDSTFLVGTDQGGDVIAITMHSRKMRTLTRAISDDVRRYVFTLGRWGDRLVNAEFQYQTKNGGIFLMNGLDGTWEKTTLNTGYSTVAAFWAEPDYLLAASYDSGIYKLDKGAREWKQLPMAIRSLGGTDFPINKPRSITSIAGRVWFGNLINGLYVISNLDSAGVRFAPDSIYNVLPSDPFALLTWRGLMFVGGRTPSIPLVHDPAKGTWKRILQNWCKDDYGDREICDYRITGRFAAIGDTLYAAAGGIILKIGWPDIPK